MPGQGIPPARYIPAERVIGEMAEWGRTRIDELSAFKVLVLGTMGGAFIAAGALLSAVASRRRSQRSGGTWLQRGSAT